MPLAGYLPIYSQGTTYRMTAPPAPEALYVNYDSIRYSMSFTLAGEDPGPDQGPATDAVALPSPTGTTAAAGTSNG